jgi:hypothetical protein
MENASIPHTIDVGNSVGENIQDRIYAMALCGLA